MEWSHGSERGVSDEGGEIRGDTGSEQWVGKPRSQFGTLKKFPMSISRELRTGSGAQRGVWLSLGCCAVSNPTLPCLSTALSLQGRPFLDTLGSVSHVVESAGLAWKKDGGLRNTWRTGM